MATSSNSIQVVSGPAPDAAALDAAIADLRRRFPRAFIDRYLDRVPRLGRDVFIAPGATVMGDVTLGDEVSVWPGAVLRGDMASVSVGARSNIQDGCVLHVGDDSPCVVGADVVVGHRAVLHGCRIDDGCLIAIQATVLDDSVVGHGSVIGAGALVTPRSTIAPGSLVLGVPGVVVRALTEEDETRHRQMAAKYMRLKDNYLRDSLRHG